MFFRGGWQSDSSRFDPLAHLKNWILAEFVDEWV